MIFKQQNTQTDKKVNPIIGLLLFIVSILLLVITGPLGFLYGLLHTLFTKGFRGVGEYLLKVAISIDQLGNVLMQYLLNLLLIKKGGYRFGNRDETISSAIGKNKRSNTLTRFGKGIDAILDVIDPNHSLDSIDYYVEPPKDVIDKLAWVHVVDGRILSTRSKGKKKFYIPGGKRELGETDTHAICREIKEELSVVLDIPSLEFIRIFKAQADGHPKGVMVQMTCYSGNYTGELRPDSEIEEIAWLTYKDKDKVSEVDLLIFDFLHEKDLLS